MGFDNPNLEIQISIYY